MDEALGLSQEQDAPESSSGPESSSDAKPFVRVSFYHNPTKKQHYIPGKFHQEKRHIIQTWIRCVKSMQIPACCQVEQMKQHKIYMYSYEQFRHWWVARFSIEEQTSELVFDPDIWFEGDRGWIAQYGPEVQSLTFGETIVPVSRVKEGHGIFFAGNIKKGSYEGFSVLDRTLAIGRALELSDSSNEPMDEAKSCTSHE